MRAEILKASEWYNHTIISHSQIECPTLCNRMKATFPAELREMIYQHLFPKNLTCKIEEGTQPWGSDDNPNFFIANKIAHILDPGFLGCDIAAETTKYCYRSAVLYFVHCREIPAFLKRPIPFSYLPAQDIINSVEILIDERT